MVLCATVHVSYKAKSALSTHSFKGSFKFVEILTYNDRHISRKYYILEKKKQIKIAAITHAYISRVITDIVNKIKTIFYLFYVLHC